MTRGAVSALPVGSGMAGGGRVERRDWSGGTVNGFGLLHPE